MKIITVETLKTFLDELNKKYGTEFYTKVEADTTFQRKGGGNVDYAELARRVPSWQWKVTLPKSDHQTVTATIGEQTYTSDFYAPQGSNVTFGVKADAGYKAGTLSLNSATLTEDVAVTVTEATEKLADGSISFPPEYFKSREDFELEVPSKVKVLELKTNAGDGDVFTYFKVVPGTKMIWKGELRDGAPIRVINAVNYIKIDPYIFVSNIRFGDAKEFTFSWSEQINEHATDIDLTELANKWIIDGNSKILAPNRFKVLKVEIGDKVKYVKLGEKRILDVIIYGSPKVNLYIENKKIFNYYDNAIGETCTVSWSDEIDTHTPDISL